MVRISIVLVSVLLTMILSSCNLGTSPTVDDVMVTPCPLLDGWVIYQTMEGDTWPVLAAQLGVDPSELATANCLAPDFSLVDGQIIQLPQALDRLPTLNPTILTCPDWLFEDFSVTGGGLLLVNPVVGSLQRCYYVRPGALITVEWPDAPSELTGVTFYRHSIQTGQEETLGGDSSAGDGFSLQWRVPSGMMPSVLYAVGVGRTSSSVRRSDAVGLLIGE